MVAMPGTVRRRWAVQRRRSGFSLAEVLVVVSLLGILASFAIPAVSQSMDQTRIDRAAYLLSSDLEHAFTLAARLQSPVRVVVDGANRSYTLRNSATNGVLVQRHLGPGSIYGLTSLASTITVEMFPNGVASGATTFVMQTAFNTRTIQMSRAGQVRVN